MLLLAPTVPCVAWSLAQPGPTMIGGKAVGPRAHAAFTPFVITHDFRPFQFRAASTPTAFHSESRSSLAEAETACCFTPPNTLSGKLRQ